MRHLYTWSEDRLLGVFTERDDKSIGFQYADDCKIAISQSLPVVGKVGLQAPKNFLLNLVPESDMTLSLLYEERHAPHGDIFGILSNMDTVGGLIFSLTSEAPQLTEDKLTVCSAESIAAQMDSLSGRELSRRSIPMRFSLAGAQSKFTMSLVEGTWYASSASLPSTHIIKIPNSSFSDCDLAENATMDLAAACNVQVARHGTFEVLGRKAYITERFDRSGIGSWDCKRLHIEDFAQALGVPPSEKYNQTLEDVVSMIRNVGQGDEIAYEFLNAYMFNAYAGNADAHIKNYSFIYDSGSVKLSPLYDAVVTAGWPHLDKALAIPLNDTYFYPEYLTESTWGTFARKAHLDDGRLVDQAKNMARMISDKMPEFFSEMNPEYRENALREMKKNTEAVIHPNLAIQSQWIPLYEDLSTEIGFDQLALDAQDASDASNRTLSCSSSPAKRRDGARDLDE